MTSALLFLRMQPAKLDIAQHPSSNGTVVAQLTGKLSLETVSGFLQDLRPLSAEKLVLDMSGVSFLDSAGVGALVQLFVHRRSKSQKFALAGLTQQGNAVMQVSGLVKLLPIFPTVEAASAT
ncbi:MAG TPA: STAS domain-containing protein [Candidatus Acidoferrum sp.]